MNKRKKLKDKYQKKANNIEQNGTWKEWVEMINNKDKREKSTYWLLLLLSGNRWSIRSRNRAVVHHRRSLLLLRWYQSRGDPSFLYRGDVLASHRTVTHILLVLKLLRRLLRMVVMRLLLLWLRLNRRLLLLLD